MNAAFEKSFGSNLRRIREECGLTQNEVASRLQVKNVDITRSALAKIEVGQRHIYPDEILAFKQIFQVSFEELFPCNLS